METLNFLDLTVVNVLLLFGVGFVGGLVSGFIGSGGAFVLTPAMMALGVPGIVAVASNMAHKFPKALVASIKRARYGQVDLKLGLTMGVFAELGVYYGKSVMTGIHAVLGNVGTDLYVSVVFIAVLSIVGGFVLRDAVREKHNIRNKTLHLTPSLARWVQSINIPYTMVYLRSIKTDVSVLFIAPLGFATGVLASAIAVGGFIGVPALMYVIGVPAIMATATELVVAFVMGMGGSILYAWDGFVDIRLSMIILAGSLFGVQIGAIGTTYVQEHAVKFVMGMIMVIVLLSRMVEVPVYLSELGWIQPLSVKMMSQLSSISFYILGAALFVGAGIILVAIVRGMVENRRELNMN